MPGKSCNQIYWSPQGKNIVLAGLKAMNGQLEFFNVDEMETMATAEHFMATDVDWDPTGECVLCARKKEEESVSVCVCERPVCICMHV